MGNVEKYKIQLVSGGPVYTDYTAVPNNKISFDSNTGWIRCLNSLQSNCPVKSNNYAVNPYAPYYNCCKDYKVNYCCAPKQNSDWCAKLYQHYWYNHYYNYGWLKVVGAGSRLDLHSYLNDQTSSVRVRPGCTLKLFKHKNCDWLLRSFTSDVNAFTAYNGNFNDQASSLTCTCN